MLLLHVQLNHEMILSQAQERVPQYCTLLANYPAPPQPLPLVLSETGESGAPHSQ
jgi:hypothetical protein